MFVKLMTKLFGSRNDRLLKQMRKEVQKINALEPVFEALSDEELKAKTTEFKERLSKVKRLMLFYLKPLQWFVKRVNVSLICVILTYK